MTQIILKPTREGSASPKTVKGVEIYLRKTDISRKITNHYLIH